MKAATAGVERIEITARPISEFPDRPRRDAVRAARIRRRAGTDLPSSDLGALSAFRFLTPGGDFIGVADTGFWFFGTIARDADRQARRRREFPHGADGRPLPARSATGNGRSTPKGSTVKDGIATVGFERDHRIAAVQDRSGRHEAGVPRPRLPGARQTNCARTAASRPSPTRIPTASTRAGWSSSRKRASTRQGNIFAAIIEGPNKGVFTVKRNGEFDITDGAFLPDGDLLLLERSFSMAAGVKMRLRRIYGESIAKGAVADGPVLFEADMGYQIDNMEGLDVWTARRRRADGVADFRRQPLDPAAQSLSGIHPARGLRARVSPGKRPSLAGMRAPLSSCYGMRSSCRDPDDMPRAALAIGAGFDLLDRKSRLPEPLRETRVRSLRPDGQHAAGLERGARGGKARHIVETVIGLAGEPFRAIVDIEQDRVVGAAPDRISSPTSVSRMVTRGSSRLPPNSSAIGPRAQATTAGTSSATVTCASSPSSASAARSVKPMPSPPIRICGLLRPRILSQDSFASASSEPLRRLFISSFEPSMIENSAPRCLRRSSGRRQGFSRCRDGPRDHARERVTDSERSHFRTCYAASAGWLQRAAISR